MARYDVFRNPDRSGFLLDVQSDLLEGLNTRVVVPLLPQSDAPDPADRLNPLIHLDGTDVVMVSQFLAAVPMTILSDPVANLSDIDTEIINALDMVFQGF